MVTEEHLKACRELSYKSDMSENEHALKRKIKRLDELSTLCSIHACPFRDRCFPRESKETER